MRFARPFLRLTRADTTGICEDLGITWWDDPTNGDHMAADEPLPDDFPLRSRVRHTLIPYLNAFAGGDIVSRFCDGAELASIEKSYLDGIAESVAAYAVTFAGDSCGSVDGDCELLRIGREKRWRGSAGDQIARDRARARGGRHRGRVPSTSTPSTG